LIVELLAWVLWPREKLPQITAVFAQPADFASVVPDVVLDRTVLPALSWTESFLARARSFQRGPIQVYMLYILGILILLLVFA